MKNGLVELGVDEGEGESESKVINQIFCHLQHPKNEVRYFENIFFTLLKQFFHIRGVFFTKVVKANIIEKRKFWDPFCPPKNPPSKNVSPRCIVHWVFSWATHNQDSTAPQNDKWHKKFSCLVSEKTGTISKDENYGRPIDAVYTFSCLREHFPNKKCILSSMTQNG